MLTLARLKCAESSSDRSSSPRRTTAGRPPDRPGCEHVTLDLKSLGRARVDSDCFVDKLVGLGGLSRSAVVPAVFSAVTALGSSLIASRQQSRALAPSRRPAAAVPSAVLTLLSRTASRSPGCTSSIRSANFSWRSRASAKPASNRPHCRCARGLRAPRVRPIRRSPSCRYTYRAAHAERDPAANRGSRCAAGFRRP